MQNNRFLIVQKNRFQGHEKEMQRGMPKKSKTNRAKYLVLQVIYPRQRSILSVRNRISCRR